MLLHSRNGTREMGLQNEAPAFAPRSTERRLAVAEPNCLTLNLKVNLLRLHLATQAGTPSGPRRSSLIMVCDRPRSEFTSARRCLTVLLLPGSYARERS